MPADRLSLSGSNGIGRCPAYFNNVMIFSVFGVSV
jgi:hypothetical protein